MESVLIGLAGGPRSGKLTSHGLAVQVFAADLQTPAWLAVRQTPDAPTSSCVITSFILDYGYIVMIWIAVEAITSIVHEFVHNPVVPT
jgi:hypothetical protein